MYAPGASPDPEPRQALGGSNEATHPHADAAEEVRAWLVSARGGAPFLSGSDGRRLADWLEGGVHVRDLLRAIDETAAHRRAKRLRGPFTLRSIEPALRRGPVAKAPRTAVVQPTIDDVPWPDSSGLEAEIAVTLVGLDDPPPEAEFLQLAAKIRMFFAEAWLELTSHHPTLLASALEDLGDVAALVDDTTRASLCEEYARERLRRQYPRLCAGGLLG